MYINKYDKNKSCSRMGTSAENNFKLVVESHNGIAESASRKENIYDHIDFRVTLFNKKFTVDVKGAKRDSRYGDINTDIVWVEFLNVSGNAGWLFGKEDFIAFETEQYNFVIFDRKKLGVWCKQVVNRDKLVTSASEALYRLYRRSGRKDLLSIIKLEDAKKNVPHMELKKRGE